MSLHIYELLGAGSYGDVHRCHYQKMEAAVKLLNIEYYDTLVREIIILQYLQEKTEHVPIVYSIAILDNNQIGIIMEQCSKINVMAPTYLPQVLKVFSKAVANLHALDIVHRDLTPNNLMIRANNTFCIIDYGLACFIGSKCPRVNYSTRVTTLTSRPPELLTEHDFEAYNPTKVDIYSTAINALFFTGYKTYKKYPKTKDYQEHIQEPLDYALSEANFPLLDQMTAFNPTERPSAKFVYESLKNNVVYCNLPRRQRLNPEAPVPIVRQIVENQQSVYTKCSDHKSYKDHLYEAFRMYTHSMNLFDQADRLCSIVCDGHCMQYAATSLTVALSLESKQCDTVYESLMYWCKLEKTLFNIYLAKTLVRSTNLSWLGF